MLTISNVAATANGYPVLKGISFMLGSGEIHALRGPNGSGKSSLAHVVAGHSDYGITAGDIRFDGSSILTKKSYERARLGIHLIPQSVPAFDGVSLLAVARAAREARGIPTDVFQLRAELAPALARLGLPDDFLLRPLHGDSSGGEKKKIELALAVVLRLKLVIADEVDAGLDADAQKVAASILRELAVTGAGVLVISHSDIFLSLLAPERMYSMRDGQIV